MTTGRFCVYEGPTGALTARPCSQWPGEDRQLLLGAGDASRSWRRVAKVNAPMTEDNVRGAYLARLRVR